MRKKKVARPPPDLFTIFVFILGRLAHLFFFFLPVVTVVMVVMMMVVVPIVALVFPGEGEKCSFIVLKLFDYDFVLTSISG